MSNFKEYAITPMGAPRMTRADAWKRPVRPVVARYRLFKDLVNAMDVKLENGNRVVFVLPMPKSWSKKKKETMNGKGCKSKPDLDNCLKALMDALFGDDAHICNLSGLEKVWGHHGCIRIYQGTAE